MKDNKVLLGNALMFDHAYMILYEKFQQGVMSKDLKEMALFVPMVVNCAFSCELFLKSMLPAETAGHKLYHQLFKELDIEVSDKIKKSIITVMQTEKSKSYSEEDFECDLKKNENAFPNWRYFHEGKKYCEFDLVFMSTFQKIVKAFALEKDKME